VIWAILQTRLATRVVATGDARAEALALADRLVALPADALQATKRALNIHLQRSVDGVLDYALSAQHRSHGTDEHKDRVARFVTNR